MLKETRAYIRYYRTVKGTIFLSFFLSVVQSVSLMPVAVLVQRVFDRALPGRDMHALVVDLGAVLGLLCLNALAVLWNRAISLRVIKAAVAEMRTRLVAESMRLTKAEYSAADIDATHAKIVNDTERIDCMTSALLTQFVPGLLVVTGLGCVLAYMNVWLFLVTLAVVPLLYGFGRLVGRKVKRSIKQFHIDFSRFSAGALFTLKFGEFIQLSTAERFELARQSAHIQDLRFSSKRMALLSTAYTIVQSNILMLAGIAVLFVGGEQVVHGSTTIGGLLSFYIALSLLSSNARNVIAAVPVMLEGKASLAAVMPLLSNEDAASGGVVSFTGASGDISFDGVHFSHGDPAFALSGINFTVDKGQTFGIFGSSGSGKSTLVNLLLGFHEPSLGAVRVGGQSVGDYDLSSYRRKVGVLSQDPFIFSGTIRENLAYGVDDADDPKIEAVCRMARIHEHVASLEHGYDTFIGERGARLSGGQKQRIAIARALLREPEILVLDEPDNNLDEAMFVEILSDIKSLPQTTIIISHNKNLRQHLDGAYDLV